jgi:hypothetical protein
VLPLHNSPKLRSFIIRLRRRGCQGFSRVFKESVLPPRSSSAQPITARQTERWGSASLTENLRQAARPTFAAVIIIHRRSRWFFINGHSPRLPATPHVTLVRPDIRMGSIACYPLTGYHGKLFSCLIFPKLVSDILLNLFCILPYRIYVVSSTPEFPISILDL